MTEDNRNENINNEETSQNKEWADELHLDSWPPVAPEQKQEQPATPPPFSAEKAEEQKPAPFFNPKFTQPMQPQNNMDYSEPMPSTYLVWSVIATVLCCFFPGIVAIIYSTKVTSRYYAKDYEGARKASEYAQYWIIGSIVVGLVVQTVYLPLMLLV